MKKDYLSWGRIFKYAHSVHQMHWRHQDISHIIKHENRILPYGHGKSYGDVCLNSNATLIDVSHLNNFISFDKDKGLLTCESGTTIGDIIDLTSKHLWFPPVAPGSKSVTIGGAIANDIHGKNHISAGTIGRWVKKFELMRSDGTSLICSPDKNPELYAASIGGLGLTGLIKWVEIQLIRGGPLIEVKKYKFKSFEKLMEINESQKHQYDYTVAWLDLGSDKKNLCRGVYMGGKHLIYPKNAYKNLSPKKSIQIPFDCPNSVLNKHSIKIFNHFYYHYAHKTNDLVIEDYESFFFPLDSVLSWNRIYGNRGLSQYQFVLPKNKIHIVENVFEIISKSNIPSFLAVFKEFGRLQSPGLLSFPKEGFTLAIDFPNNRPALKKLYAQLDAMILNHDGRLYPAKDDHMSSELFHTFYPNLEEFKEHVDPNFSSNFWRRTGLHEK